MDWSARLDAQRGSAQEQSNDQRMSLTSLRTTKRSHARSSLVAELMAARDRPPASASVAPSVASLVAGVAHRIASVCYRPR